jgi:hypothetical protein
LAAVSNPFVDSVSSFSVEVSESEPVSLLDSVLVDVVDASVDAAVDAPVDAVVVVVVVFVSEHPVIEKVVSITNNVPADTGRAIREENWFENLNL